MVTNSEVWMGSGASVTLVPESDLFLGYFNSGFNTATATDDATKGSFMVALTTSHGETGGSGGGGGEFASKYALVENLYTGCVADFYRHNGTLILSRVISGNGHSKIYFNETYAHADLDAECYIIIRKFGAPVFGPRTDVFGDGGAQPTLLADNWLGIVNTITFPNPEIEVLQKNLALGGSRNFTFQFKGMENAAGGSFEVSANQGTWLYYALGKCTNINATFTDVTNITSAFISNADGFFQDHAATSDYSGNDGPSQTSVGGTGFHEQGPFFYRGVGSVVCPPVLPSDADDDTSAGGIDDANLEKLTQATETSGTIAQPIVYTFGEANGSDLPSFTLEHVINKGSPTKSMLSDGTDQTYSTSADDSQTQTLRVSDEVFTRLATGNMVNTLTLMANEGEELKMQLDLMTKQIVKPQSNDTTSSAGSAYFARRGVTDDRSLINFGSGAGGANNTVDSFLKPFFFHDGSLSVFGQQFLKITNFTLTINNNLQEKRFIGNYKKGSKSILPAQRMYEITLSGLVTDSLLFDQLINESENTSDGSGSLDQFINLNFTKENGEQIVLEFKDYFVSASNFPIPEDNSPFIVDATIMPRSLKACTVKTHWVLQG